VGGAAALLTLAAASTALAQDADPAYPPTVPTAAAGICVGDIPFFQYQVDFGSDEFVGDPMTITFQNPSGDDFVISTTVPARGASATVLWPGASESPPDWPGWVNTGTVQNPVWEESTTDSGAFTRAPGGVTVDFETNPTLSTNVVYPPATAICANPKNPPTTTTTSGGQGQPTTSAAAPTGVSLPRTGAQTAAIALVAGGLVAAGTTLVVSSRRKSARSEV
jgi:LPXTG-motif cell wall-anchored protein